VVLVVLAVVWSVYGLSWWRSREHVRPGRSINSFEQHMAHLGRTMGHAPVIDLNSVRASRVPVVAGSQMARHRRRGILKVLLAAVGSTVLLTLATGGSFLIVQLVADLLLSGYVVLLVRARRLADERRAKVVQLRAPLVAEPVLLSRSGS